MSFSLFSHRKTVRPSSVSEKLRPDTEAVLSALPRGFALSPVSGLVRASWKEAARRLLAGVFASLADRHDKAALTARMYRDMKCRLFLLKMSQGPCTDPALEKELIRRIRFRFRSVFYEKMGRSRRLRSLAFATFPGAYLRRLRRKNAVRTL